MFEEGTFGSLNDEQEEIIELMCASCRYMANLIEIILKAYSDFGRIKLNKTKFDIAELISALYGETKGLFMEKGQTLIFHNFSQTPIIYADKLQIRRVILNLLSNAVMYGFCDTKIEITLKVSEGSCEFFVENYSKQIPPEELSKVFDKYSKTKYSHFNKAGTGLGLYLAKQIIEKHKGMVYAKSEADGKCTFGFIIPNKTDKIKRCQTPEKSASSYPL
jgi:two-component system phosphate regulon sensor histidine kinase PhoR